MDSCQNEIIMSVARKISTIVPDCCGVTLGGSRALSLEDEQSDVEMYFYTNLECPSLEKINQCMDALGATHKRSESFLWNEEPWGPHSFFVISDLYFEIGYRKISETNQRITAYLNGLVEPQKDCHDLGLGYMLSGLAASVIHEKELLLCGSEIEKLKTHAKSFPATLFEQLRREYYETARSLYDGKLRYAAMRGDVFSFYSISSRIIRALLVMAFALSGEHFPGDKWNEQLLAETSWHNKNEFLDELKRSFQVNDISACGLIERWTLIGKALLLIEMDMRDYNG